MRKGNMFEMLGLEFDPPDNVKKIRAAYENWKKKLTSELNTTVDESRIKEIREELNQENLIALTMENPRLRQQSAESLKKERIEQLRLYIDLQRGDTLGTMQVNQTQIRQISDKLKLCRTTIETTYKEQGFEIKPEMAGQKILKLLNEFFMTDSIMEELRKNIKAFKQVPDEKNFPWSDKVNDLYEMAFYLENETEEKADTYRHLPTEELREIFRNEAKKYSAPVEQWQSLKALLNLAQTQVFNSDESRFKYDHSIKTESMQEFFEKIKSAPEVFKRDSSFADNCIKLISRKFPFLTYELSAALYNKAACLLKNPYESALDPQVNAFCLRCVNCGNFENFRSREEAQNARCKICGEKFFMECPKCGKKNPSTAKKCSACNFPLSEFRKFPEYISAANSMLDLVEQARSADDDVHIVTAEIIRLLAKARELRPEAQEVRKLEWRINKISIEFRKRELLMWAEKKLPSLSIAPEKAVSDCVEILRKIRDFKPAQERLKLIPPKSPTNFIATMRENYSPAFGKISVKAKSTGASLPTSNLICNLSWQVPKDLGLTYTLIKKVDGVPKTYRDGEILIENSNRLEFADVNVKPGVLYGYAIFSTRLGTISEPTTAVAVHYSDADEKKLIAKTEGCACKFIWRLPSENCLGIRILRSDSAGKSVVVADCVQSPFTDRSVKNRKTYQYRLQCVYRDAQDETINQKIFSRRSDDALFSGVWNIEKNYKYSHGLTVTLTPENPPKLLENLICTVKGGRAIFHWKSTSDFSVWFKEIIKDVAIDRKIFEIDRVDELFGSGVVCKKAESLDQMCEFPLSAETVKIAVISATHEFGMLNEIFTCANVEPCEIDAQKTQIDAGGLKLVLKSVPENLYMIHYRINASDADELYASIETAKSRRMNRIYATKYEMDKFISQTHLPPKEIFITVIGEYRFPDGTEAYCAPSTLTLDNRPKEVISYRLEWGTSGLFKKEVHAKNCKLIIESRAKPTPKMFLVCRSDGRMNIEAGDSATKILGTVRACQEGYVNGRLEFDLPNEIWKEISSGTVVKLLTSKDDEKIFELKASRPDSLIVPKK